MMKIDEFEMLSEISRCHSETCFFFKEVGQKGCTKTKNGNVNRTRYWKHTFFERQWGWQF
jgi:hypothetical protein